MSAQALHELENCYKVWYWEKKKDLKTSLKRKTILFIH